MIVRKKLDLIPSNYACDDTANDVNGAILNLDRNDGRRLSEIFIDNLVKNFNGTVWGSNGPLLISRVLRDLCKTNETSKMIEKKSCEGFHVLPNFLCYPFSGYGWGNLFNESLADTSMKKINEKDSMVVHFWNKLTKHVSLSVNSNCTYVKLAKQFCPKVIETCGEYF
jgi:lactosylceramide 4-alpha-galactosyltransferase